MTFETLIMRIRDELARSRKPIDVSSFLATYLPHDIEAGQLLIRVFNARLLRGRHRTTLVQFEGHIAGIADDTRPVWN